MGNEILSGDTLVIFSEWDEMKLYILHWHECSQYEKIDNRFLNIDALDDNPPGIDNAIEHLAYMLGVEPYYGTAIPPLDSRPVSNHDVSRDTRGESSNFVATPPAVAPWALRQVTSKVVNFRKIIRVIRTGWYS